MPKNSLRTAHQNLAEHLLNDDQGINEAAYSALIDILCSKDAKAVSRQTDATDGRFYTSGPIQWED